MLSDHRERPASRLVRLTYGHLLFDHCRMHSLLDMFERCEDAHERLSFMRVALDLFYIHTWLEESLFGFRTCQRVLLQLSDLVNRLEASDPANYECHLCGLHFAKYLREQMAEEERRFVTEPRMLSRPVSYDSEILVQRRAEDHGRGRRSAGRQYGSGEARKLGASYTQLMGRSGASAGLEWHRSMMSG